MSNIYDKEIEMNQVVKRHRRFRDKMKSLLFGKKYDETIADRRTSIITIVGDSWSVPKKYKKNTYNKMVLDFPDLRGAITASCNAAIGDYSIKTAEKLDDEGKKKNKTLIDKYETWLGNPIRNVNRTLRQMYYSLEMRDCIFLEISKPKKDENKDPWFYVINPTHIEPKYNPIRTQITHFEYKDPSAKTTDGTVAKPVILSTDKVVYTTMDSLDGDNEPSPLLESLISGANLAASAENFARNLFDSGGLGRMAFILEESKSPDEFEALKIDIANRKGASMAIKGKVKIEKLSMTLAELEYDKIIQRFVEKIMTLLSTPPIIMSKPDSTFKDTGKQEMNSFYSKLRSKQRVINNAVDQSMIRIHTDEGARFHLDKWVDPVTEAQIFEIMTRIGAKVVNEIRAEMGLPPVDWGEEPYNFNFPPQRERLEREQMAQQNNQQSGKQEGDTGNDAKADDLQKRMNTAEQDLIDLMIKWMKEDGIMEKIKVGRKTTDEKEE